MENKRKTGSIFERAEEEYLVSLGWRILSRNYRTRMGEIDLIAMDGRTLVFAEVKYRTSTRKGSGAEAVDERKQRQIIGMSLSYMAAKHMMSDQPVRYDVVCASPDGICLIRNAFNFGGL